jgi:hypothetical protein
MKTNLTLLAVLALASGAIAARAQEQPAAEMPGMATPVAEHKALEQFAGEWTCSASMQMPGETEPMECKGAESARLIGGLWFVATGKSEMAGMEGESMITIGYDPKQKQYVGTFVCSAQDFMWEYTGKFDETGKKLILSTTGPSMLDPTVQTAKYQEVLETVDANHKTFTSSIQGPDGKWVELMKMTYERAK